MADKAYCLTVDLQMENAAFDEDRAAEAARVLRRLADRFETGGKETLALRERGAADGWLFDLNGNSCGTWRARVRRFRS